MILRRVLTKILHGIDDLRAVLHLIKDDQGLFRHNPLTAGQHQVLQNAVHVLGRLKKLFVLLIFVKVKINRVFIITSAELLQNPGLSHLTHAL